jgi:2,4-dienoyl-CoA reductase (NADPH2)
MKLLTPLDLKFTHLKNRVVMGSMHTGLEEGRGNVMKLAAFYKERADVGLIITGGIAPNRIGRLTPFASKLSSKKELTQHRIVTDVVHEAGGKIALQILHSGRYGYHPFIFAPSRIKAAISPFTPFAMSTRYVYKTISHYIRCATLAKAAGYDGVEVMGSEGYLISQFLNLATNRRQDVFGGDYAARMRFPLEIVKGIKQALGPEFLLIYRLSVLDLVPDASSWDEIVLLAQHLESLGVDLFNTGIGWHEARIPTIASMVPPAAFTSLGKKLKAVVKVPVIVSNRINTVDIANKVLEDAHGDLVSMARPLLADPHFVKKLQQEKPQPIQVCIACNQACLDHVFMKKRASCMLNPQACYETELIVKPATVVKNLAVVGAGPAGLHFAKIAAMRGHSVTLLESQDKLGGQFNLAREIPGKEDYQYAIDYFAEELHNLGVKILLNTTADIKQLVGYDEVIVATGTRPRIPDIDGIDFDNVMTYADVLMHKKVPGRRVAVIGSGGIGIDVALWLVKNNTENFYDSWGIDLSGNARGGLKPQGLKETGREVYVLQRGSEKLGKRLGKTTGWVHRLELKHHKIKFIPEVEYKFINYNGLHICVNGVINSLAVDSVIICAGQVEHNSLFLELQNLQIKAHVIGGAHLARELDAKNAILSAHTLAARI